MNSPLGLDYRRKLLSVWRTKQFDLAYYAHIGLDVTEELIPFDLDSFYELLTERKKNEFEAKKKAYQEAADKSKTSAKRSKKRK